MPDDTPGMHRTAAARHRKGELTLEAAEAANPEWAPWLRLLRRARAAPTASWALDVGLSAARAAGAPVLHGALIAVDEARARAWLTEFLAAAAAESEQPDAYGDLAHGVADALDLFGAAISLDGARLEERASAHRCDPSRLAAVLQLAVSPLLMACRQRLAGELPRGWTHGWCALCGAWPAFAETRGLERERRARCGRCAFEWRFDVLRCPYCDEREHDQLASLVIEGDETRRIDTCRTCGGYLKSIATLMAVPDDRVAVRDLETIELDLVAAERGLVRPADRTYAAPATVVARGEGAMMEEDRTWFLA